MSKPIRSSLRALTVTFENLFRKPTCYDYPFNTRERAPRYRASFALLHDEAGDERCIGCKKCQNICPSGVITVTAEKRESPVTGKKRGYSSDFTLDLEACCFCELCVQVCPEDAIAMGRLAEAPGYSREDLCLTMDKLYANEKKLPLIAELGEAIRASQEPPKPKPVAAAPAPAAGAAKPAAPAAAPAPVAAAPAAAPASAAKEPLQ